MVEWLPSMFKALDSVPNMLIKLLQHALEALKKICFSTLLICTFCIWLVVKDKPVWIYFYYINFCLLFQFRIKSILRGSCSYPGREANLIGDENENLIQTDFGESNGRQFIAFIVSFLKTQCSLGKGFQTSQSNQFCSRGTIKLKV